MHFLTNYFGTGSRSHCFDSAFWIAFATFLKEIFFKQLSSRTKFGRIDGGGAPAVDAYIVATFPVE